MRDALVVGLGAVDRGDDGIGPVVVRLVQEVLAAGGVAEPGPSIVGPPARVSDPPAGVVPGLTVSGMVVSGPVPGEAVPGAIPEVVVHEDPTALVELMAGRSLAVIVDALRSPGKAGSVHVLEAGQTPLPAPTDPGPAGSHGFGLASSLELARALGALPPRVVVVGVVGTRFTVGAPLSDPVAAAVPVAAAAVLRALGLPQEGPGSGDSGYARSHWEASATRRREVGHVH